MTFNVVLYFLSIKVDPTCHPNGRQWNFCSIGYPYLRAAIGYIVAVVRYNKLDKIPCGLRVESTPFDDSRLRRGTQYAIFLDRSPCLYQEL